MTREKYTIEIPPNDKIEKYETLPFEKELIKLPALEKGKDLWQNNFHEFDVYDHTLKFVEFIKKFYREENRQIDPNLIAASYLHDIGKPVVAIEKIKNGVLQEKEPGKPYHEFEDHEKNEKVCHSDQYCARQDNQ